MKSTSVVAICASVFLLTGLTRAFALPPPGKQTLLRPTHDRIAVTLRLNHDSACNGMGPPGNGFGHMFTLDSPGGEIAQDPFVVPHTANFVITDIEWRAIPAIPNHGTEDPFNTLTPEAVELVATNGYSIRMTTLATRVLPTQAVGEHAFTTGGTWSEGEQVCVYAQRWPNYEQVDIASAIVHGYVDDTSSK